MPSLATKPPLARQADRLYAATLEPFYGCAAGLPVTLEYLTISAIPQNVDAVRRVKDERYLDRFDRVFGHVFKGLEAPEGDMPSPGRMLRKILFVQDGNASPTVGGRKSVTRAAAFSCDAANCSLGPRIQEPISTYWLISSASVRVPHRAWMIIGNEFFYFHNCPYGRFDNRRRQSGRLRTMQMHLRVGYPGGSDRSQRFVMTYKRSIRNHEAGHTHPPFLDRIIGCRSTGTQCDQSEPVDGSVRSEGIVSVCYDADNRVQQEHRIGASANRQSVQRLPNVQKDPPLSANLITETPATFGITVGRWR